MHPYFCSFCSQAEPARLGINYSQQLAIDYRLIFVNGYTPGLTTVLTCPNLDTISGDIRPEDIADNLSMLLELLLHTAPHDLSELFFLLTFRHGDL